MRRFTAILATVVVMTGAIGCGDSKKTTGPTPTPIPATATPIPVAACFDTTVEAARCDPEVATFTLDSTNPYYPLVPGLRVVLEGEEDGEAIRVERTVLTETEVVAGVETHVLEHLEFVDGEILEVARNFYVEATDGTVCYFGEDVEFYEDGMLANMDGSWRAGVDGAKPGVIMPAVPAVGDAYFQEQAPDALDMGRVSDVNQSRTIGGYGLRRTVDRPGQRPVGRLRRRTREGVCARNRRDCRRCSHARFLQHGWQQRLGRDQVVH